MSSQPYTWRGEHNFNINGSGMHEDTLRIVQNYRKNEQMLKLVLPTLCITYADMKFQNAIGGMQMNYPGSAIYGPAHFDPPVILNGDDIEKFTYIRGAHQVEIGPDKTVVVFPCWKDLVIPRLRIDQKPGAAGLLAVDNTKIEENRPLQIEVRQYADGRHVGGLTIESRHPKYVEPQMEPIYDLWVRVIDAKNNQPLQETIVDIWHWDPQVHTKSGPGDFVLQSSHHTNGTGIVEVGDLPAKGIQWCTVRLPGWRIHPRCFRPLPRQPVRLHMNAWQMQDGAFRDTWRKSDDLRRTAELTRASPDEILKLNHIAGTLDLSPGMEITLPCFMATYRPESWENLEDIARRFGMRSSQDLARANGLRDIKQYNATLDLELNGWRFFHARLGDSLMLFDRAFGLPKRSTVPVHRVYRPREGALLPTEVIAVPTSRLADELEMHHHR